MACQIMKCENIHKTEEHARSILRDKKMKARYNSSEGYRFLKEVDETVEVVGAAATTENWEYEEAKLRATLVEACTVKTYLMESDKCTMEPQKRFLKVTKKVHLA